MNSWWSCKCSIEGRRRWWISPLNLAKQLTNDFSHVQSWLNNSISNMCNCDCLVTTSEISFLILKKLQYKKKLNINYVFERENVSPPLAKQEAKVKKKLWMRNRIFFCMEYNIGNPSLWNLKRKKGKTPESTLWNSTPNGVAYFSISLSYSIAVNLFL